MKVTVTQEHFDRASARTQDFKSGEIKELWGQGCLIAQACKDAGLGSPLVTPNLAYDDWDKRDDSFYYVLPQEARRAITEFDLSQSGCKDFTISLPFEFELGEPYTRALNE